MDAWERSLAVFQATTVLLSDRPRSAVDAVLFFSRTHTDHDGLLEVIRDIWNGTGAREVFVNGSRGEREGGTVPGEANPGKDFYFSMLCANGIPQDRIVAARLAFSTREENETFLELALGMVNAMAKRSHWIPVFAAIPGRTDWRAEVCGSQGKKRMPRFGHLAEEFQRICLYQTQGNLATFSELFAYLAARDSGAFSFS